MRSAFNISRTRQCPQCASYAVVATRKKADDFELFVLPLLFMRPYRCTRCGSRHYNLSWARRNFTATPPGGEQVQVWSS